VGGYGLLALLMVLAQQRRAGEVHWIGAAIVAAVVLTILVMIIAIARLVQHRRLRACLRHGWASAAHVEVRLDDRKAPGITLVRAQWTSEGASREASFVVPDPQLPLLTATPSRDGAAVIHRPGPKALALLLVPGRLAVLEYRQPR